METEQQRDRTVREFEQHCRYYTMVWTVLEP